MSVEVDLATATTFIYVPWYAPQHELFSVSHHNTNRQCTTFFSPCDINHVKIVMKWFKHPIISQNLGSRLLVDFGFSQFDTSVRIPSLQACKSNLFTSKLAGCILILFLGFMPDALYSQVEQVVHQYSLKRKFNQLACILIVCFFVFPGCCQVVYGRQEE